MRSTNRRPVTGALSAEIADTNGVLKAPWHLNVDGEPFAMGISKGTSYVYDVNQEILQVREKYCTRTITPHLEVSIDQQDGVCQVEFLMHRDHGEQHPYVEINQRGATIWESCYTARETDMFFAAAVILRDPIYNPFGFLPSDPNQDYHRFDLKTGAIRRTDGTPMDQPLPDEPCKMVVETLRKIEAADRHDDSHLLPPGLYEVRPSFLKEDRSGYEQWFLLGISNNDYYLEKMFVPYDVFIREYELGHVLVRAVLNRETLDNPIFQELIANR